MNSGTSKGTFKYYMTLQGKGGFAQTVKRECRHIGERDLAKSSYNFLLAEKLNSQLLLLYFICGRKTSYGGRELVKNFRIPSFGGRV